MPERKPRVVYWNSIPSPYMTARFDAVADRGNLDFEAWFNSPISPTRPWRVCPERWHFHYQYLPELKLRGLTLSLPAPLLARRAPDVLVSLYDTPSFIAGSLFAQRRGVRTAYWCEVTHDHIEHRHWLKEVLKHRLFRWADGITTVGPEGVHFARRYGTPPKQIFALGHSFDQAGFRAVAEEARHERKALRQQLGLKGTTFVYSGRFLWLKGLNYLLDAFGAVQQRLNGEHEVSLLLVGVGPEDEALQRQSVRDGLRNVVFAGFQQQEALPRYYAAADVFVFPTLGDTYGLVVDEAMTCSLPVISTSAAGEIRERIEDGVNGFIVPPRDSSLLADRMERLACDAALRMQMGTVSALAIRKFAPECWAEKFELAVERLLSAPETTVPSTFAGVRRGAIHG